MTVAEEVLRVARPYLGLATYDLLSRVSRTLVGVTLAEIGPERVHSLAYWVGISASRLMAPERARELAERIRHVHGNGRP